MRISPTISRRRREPLALSADSRSACTGATRAARRAGKIDEMIVTTVPTTNATTTVRGSSWSDVLGRSIPNAESNPFSAMAIPIPAMRPNADASNPVTNASTTTEVMTCPRLAPIARSSAISRVRCATMIENVLKMMNAPTNSAMNAKTSSAVRKNPNASCNCFACSSATSDDLTASMPFGSSAWMLVRRSGTDVPSSATTSIWSNSPTLSSTFCAVATSNAASVAPARLSASPNPRMPVIVNSCGGPWNRIVMVSPMARSNFLAVAASTPTSVGPAGGSPSRSESGDVGPSVQLAPSVGGPTPPIASPVAGSIICAYPVTVPDASATPGTACTVARTSSGTGLRSSPPPPPGPS